VPDTAAWIALILFLGVGYLVAKVVLIRRQKAIVVIYFVCLVAAFLFIKQYAFLKAVLPATLFERVIAATGWSYMLFRQIHLVVDAYEGQIENLSCWNYLNYQINLFGFIAGPIQRYQDFCQSWLCLTPITTGAEAVLRAYLRIFTGILKITVLAGFCIAKFDKWSAMLLSAKTMGQDSHWVTVVKLLGVFYLYPAYIYFNFSGYCDMVIGGASLVGMKMPENFDRPYVSRNMIDYWTRFHRTLGFWVRDYLFAPIYRAIAVRWPAKAIYLAFLCYFIAFFLAGVWHGSTWNFVIYGLLNAIGVAAAKLWETWLIKKRGRKGLRTYLQSKPIRVVAIAATLHYVCLTLLFFPADMGKTRLMLNQAYHFIV
jgi:D-alanyl-lipoteichoic acid acyltransferase DltB (MBOAT superfamily)